MSAVNRALPEVALLALARGIGVFPCRVAGHEKKPCTKHGHLDAVTTIADAEDLWRDAPNATHVGLRMGDGLVAIDFDTYKPMSDDERAAHDALRGLMPSTWIQTTQRKGEHLFFRLPAGIEVRNSESKIAKNVDVRGDGGWICTGPNYKPTDDEIADAPEWLVEILREKVRKPLLASPVVNVLKEGTTTYGRKVLADECARLREAANGTRNGTLVSVVWKIAGWVKGQEIDENDARSSILDAATACGLVESEPAKTDGTIERAWKAAPPRQKEPRPARGAVHTKVSDTVSDDDDSAPVEDEQDPWTLAVAQARADLEGALSTLKGHASKPLFIGVNDLLTATVEPVRWLVSGIIRDSAFFVVAGRAKSSKTWATLDMALAIVTGGKAFGEFQAVDDGRSVFYLSPETSLGDCRLRMCALAKGRDIDISGLDGRLFFAPMTGLAIDDVESLASLVASVRASGTTPALVVLDPLRDLFEGEENSSDDMGTVVRHIRALRSVLSCAVVLIHHSGKDGKETSSRSGGQKMRGSSALHGGVDGGLYLKGDSVNGVSAIECPAEVELRSGRGAGGFFLRVDFEDDATTNEATSAVFSFSRSPSRVDGGPPQIAVLEALPEDTRPESEWLSGRACADKSGVSQGAIGLHLKRLLETGHVVKRGTKTRPIYARASLPDGDPFDD